MKRISNKLLVVAIALCALVIVGSFGAAAFWSVSQNVAQSNIKSSNMQIAVTNEAGGQVAAPLNVPSIMPGDAGSHVYVITPNTGNLLTDLWFKVENVQDTGTLKDNLMVGFFLTTSGQNTYWLTPSGAVSRAQADYTADLANHVYFSPAKDFNNMIWQNIPGYTSIESGQFKHITAFYWLPETDTTSYGSDLKFDMTFGLSQHHNTP